MQGPATLTAFHKTGTAADQELVCCRSIAQGCSEYNITVLIDQKDSVRALRAVHGRFYLATLPLGVGLVGPGLIGGTFLDQIHQQMTVCSLCHVAQQHMAVDPPWEVAS